MANSNLVIKVSSILLALMFFNGTFSALGRPLKTENSAQVTTYENRIDKMGTVPEKTILWRRHTLDAASAQNPPSDGVGNWTDNFRPTVPGHSPGAGHSSPHANVVPKP